MLKVVVCVSGGGTNLQAIIDAMEAGKITNAEIKAVISNNAGAKALDRAAKHGIEGICFSPKSFASREAFNEAFTEKMKELAPDLIVLAGFSNSGKSTSLKYLDPTETFIVSCTNKQLQIPGFRKKYKKVTIEDKKLVGNWLVSNSYEKINKILDIVNKTRPDVKIVVIDDINYCSSGEIMDNALVKGYEKFTMQAKNYYDLITNAGELRDDLTVVFISHIINDGTDIDPQYKLYSSGKMLDKTVNIDGLFSYIIYSERYIDEATGEVGYRFKTRTDGNDTCRSVAGCFSEKYIEPNMQTIIDTINKFEEGEE